MYEISMKDRCVHVHAKFALQTVSHTLRQCLHHFVSASDFLHNLLCAHWGSAENYHVHSFMLPSKAAT